ncbi:hypothetical protein [Mangrovimonas sp. ST2L15]|uniref:hypothetical protein n=1 Tax=Mangrovimonas sp. ST2L15 TaxID=1645916 RepID=UPI000A9AE7BD|nr:hypothetical protein [Mangrovimonas sp. ST2L15]
MKNPRDIKELLQIDIDFLCENSRFKSDLINDQNDTRNFLLFDLKSKFLDLFDQFQISLFEKKARHLELNSLNPNPEKIKKILELIVSEYETDENNQSASDWNASKHLSWWFKNDKHHQTYDEPENMEDLFYGFIIDGLKDNQVTLAILDYKNIDPKLNKKNWLQQRV